jgi:hypothetical protein
MSNYTTKTAALKATKIDSRLLDAKQIDTKKLFINGELFDPSKIKESPNEAMFQLMIAPLPDDEEKGAYTVRNFFNAPDEIDGCIYVYAVSDYELGETIRFIVRDVSSYDLYCEEI